MSCSIQAVFYRRLRLVYGAVRERQTQAATLRR
jgi:hypothetical protein